MSGTTQYGIFAKRINRVSTTTATYASRFSTSIRQRHVLAGAPLELRHFVSSSPSPSPSTSISSYSNSSYSHPHASSSFRRVRHACHSRLHLRHFSDAVNPASASIHHGRRPPLRVAIIGSGPAGFYAAARLLEQSEAVWVDMYEALPVPFGLVRFGVAPDHPEVKVRSFIEPTNCQDRFTSVANSPRFHFIGNLSIGSSPTSSSSSSSSPFASSSASSSPSLPLHFLTRHYTAILFAYGASQDRQLNLPGESSTPHILSARAFVGWYNGLPEYRDLNPDLSAGEDAIIVGQGNVALDVARILLTDVDVLRRTDITEYALEGLRRSKIKHVRVVGRRGPVQASWTGKEVRELLNLPGVKNMTDLNALPCDEEIAQLPRPTKRLMQQLKKAAKADEVETEKSFSLDFLLSPKSLNSSSSNNSSNLKSVTFTKNRLQSPLDPSSRLLPLSSETEDLSTVTLPCTTLFRSVGYKSLPLPGFSDLGIPFDEARGVIPNDASGRVVASDDSNTSNRSRAISNASSGISDRDLDQNNHLASSQKDENKSDSANDSMAMATKTAATKQVLPGLYTAGWVKRGPTGVIASTMADAFISADAILSDWDAQRPFLEALPVLVPSETSSATGSSPTSGSLTTSSTQEDDAEDGQGKSNLFARREEEEEEEGEEEVGGWAALKVDAQQNHGIDLDGAVVDWEAWLRIDAAERERGRKIIIPSTSSTSSTSTSTSTSNNSSDNGGSGSSHGDRNGNRNANGNGNGNGNEKEVKEAKDITEVQVVREKFARVQEMVDAAAARERI